MATSIEERLSKVEGIVSEHDRIFDMIHAEIRDVKVFVDCYSDTYVGDDYHDVGYDIHADWLIKKVIV